MKIIILLIISSLLISCSKKQIKVPTQHNLYEKDLEKAIQNKNLKRGSFILKHSPDIKTLDYYLLFVKFHKINKSLDKIDIEIRKTKNIFVKEYLKGLKNFIKGIYFYKSSLTHFRNALKVKSSFHLPISELYYNIAVLESKNNNFDKALEMINLALSVERGKYYVLKGYILYEKGDFYKARNLLNDSFNKIERVKDFKKIEKIMMNIEHSFNPLPIKVKNIYQKWLSIAQTGRQSIHVLMAAKRGMEEFPEYSEMYTLAGLASIFIDRKNDAINYFKKAIILDENKIFNYIQLAILYKNLKLISDVKEILEKSLTINRYVPIVYLYLSKVELELGNPKKALNRKEEELKFGKTLHGYKSLVSLSKIKTTKERKAIIQKAIKLYPDEPSFYKSMALLYNDIIEETTNPDKKFALKKEQSKYYEIYEEKNFEKSKKRLEKPDNITPDNIK